MGFVGSEKSLPIYASLDSCLFQARNKMLRGSGSCPGTGCVKASPPVCSMGKVCTCIFDFTADLRHSLALERPSQKDQQFSGEAEVTGL